MERLVKVKVLVRTEAMQGETGTQVLRMGVKGRVVLVVVPRREVVGRVVERGIDVGWRCLQGWRRRHFLG